MERLVRIAAVLSASPKHGVPVDRLVAIAGFRPGESGREQLQRELRYLERQGWQIERVSHEGERATYRMTTLDNRLRVRLSPPEAAALQRAAMLARRSDLIERVGLTQEEVPTPAPVDVRLDGEPSALSAVLEAVRRRALLRFSYKGTTRLAHPQSVAPRHGRWYLHALEDDAAGDTATEVKAFVVARMSGVEALAAGTARHLTLERRPDLHPMRWEIDPPVEVMLRTQGCFRADVVRWLLEPMGEHHSGDTLDLRYRVTNRSAFRARLYELGTRVELLGPSEVRAEVLAELESLAGGAGDGG